MRAEATYGCNDQCFKSRSVPQEVDRGCGYVDWMPACADAKTLGDIPIMQNERYGGMSVLMMHERIRECRRKRKKNHGHGFYSNLKTA